MTDTKVTDKTREIVRNFITQNILHKAQGILLGDDDQLIDMGIIDSMGIMRLLTFLENEFSFQIPSEDLLPENFASVGTISSLIDRCMLHK